MSDTWVTQSDFARLTNVTRAAVNKAIKTGRLQNSIKKNEHGRTMVNVAAAQLEWKINTDPSMNKRGIDAKIRPYIKPREGGNKSAPVFNDEGQMDVNEARRLEQEYKGRLAKLKYDLDSGQYVDANLMKAEWISIITSAKTKILALPSKAKAAIPHLTGSDIEILDRLIREALEDLASGD